MARLHFSRVIFLVALISLDIHLRSISGAITERSDDSDQHSFERSSTPDDYDYEGSSESSGQDEDPMDNSRSALSTTTTSKPGSVKLDSSIKPSTTTSHPVTSSEAPVKVTVTGLLSSTTHPPSELINAKSVSLTIEKPVTTVKPTSSPSTTEPPTTTGSPTSSSAKKVVEKTAATTNQPKVTLVASVGAATTTTPPLPPPTTTTTTRGPTKSTKMKQKTTRASALGILKTTRRAVSEKPASSKAPSITVTVKSPDNDSGDNLLAILRTKSGEMKLRNLDESIIKRFLKLDDMPSSPPPDVSSSPPSGISHKNSFEFPAGRYFFPRPMRLIGLFPRLV